jgi:NAD(P)H dehydrogenase (quinone)
VTGATGKTGSNVVTQLREKNWDVRAVVRSYDARSERLKQLGAEIVIADLYDYDRVLAALKGTTRAYFCPPVQPYMIQAATVFAAAAQEAQIESIVQLSQWLASPAHPSLHTRQLWLVEKLFSMIPGVAHTVVNPGAFADTFLQVMPIAANLGIYPNVFGNLRNAPASNEDMARVVVGVLVDPDRHAGKRYRPTGPKLISMADIAEMVGRVVARKVVLQDLPPEMFLKVAKAAGVSPFEITNVRHYVLEGRRDKVFAVNAPTTDVYDLSGQQPEDFETTARRYAQALNAQRTLPNRLREIRNMIRILTTTPFDAERHDTEQQYPIPSQPQLAADSEIW